MTTRDDLARIDRLAHVLADELVSRGNLVPIPDLLAATKAMLAAASTLSAPVDRGLPRTPSGGGAMSISSGRERRVLEPRITAENRVLIPGAHPMSNAPVNRRRSERRVASYRWMVEDLVESYDGGTDEVAIHELVLALRAKP